MHENITAIKDPTVHIKPSEKVKKFLQENSESLIEYASELPENLKCLLESKETLLENLDIQWLNEFLKSQKKSEKVELLTGQKLYDELDRIIKNNYSGFNFDGFLEEKNKNEVYLHNLLKGCELILPENEKVQRNPILEERIERLRKEQEEREYKEMTKNVDMNKKRSPEDTISFQINMMNRHLIAVLQFLVSVGAGFAFGFLGIELAIGKLNFGIRLLLGIAFALIIAVAEFYFLARQLNEEEKEASNAKENPVINKVKTYAKLHED